MLVHTETLLAADVRHLELAAPESVAATTGAVWLPEVVAVDVAEQGADGGLHCRPGQPLDEQSAAKSVQGQLGKGVLLLALGGVICKVKVKVTPRWRW